VQSQKIYGGSRPIPIIAILGGLAAASIALSWTAPATAQDVDPNSPGVLEPVLTAIDGVARRIPHTDQANGDQLLTPVGPVVTRAASDSQSILGHPITSVESPNDDMKDALKDMFDAAKDDDVVEMRAAARELKNILMGTTEGRIYDGFAMLNFNRGAFMPDHLPGEYKMKVLRDTGLTEPGIRGGQVKIWEVDINMFFYDGQIDSDTFLVRVPVGAGEFDTVRINYRIYSVDREDFAPTVVMLDRRMPGSVQFPFKGFDSVWIPFSKGDVVEFTMATPPLGLQRGIYT